nr:Fe2+-enterobactin ABC transporter substrate-binding protein [Vibrio sonorensis]
MRIILIILVFFAGFAYANPDPVWPQTFVNADGSSTVIPSKPKRILSTSVTVTGTLLAIDAPVIASASAVTGKFFGQWEHLAKNKNVANVWPAGSVDLESAYIHQPDLIVISASGADSALAQRAEFELIAPTIVVNYSGQTWQDFTYLLGSAIGMEREAAQAIQSFEDYVAESKSKLNLPEGKANIVSYTGPGSVNAIAKGNGAHGKLLTALGFDLETPLDEWDTSVMNHKDFLTVHYESLTHLQGTMTFLLRSDDADAQAFANDPVMVNLPSVQQQQVYGLGKYSFRIDLLSAKEIVDNMVERFGQP